MVTLYGDYDSPFETMKHAPEWQCACGKHHRIETRRALAYLCRAHGMTWLKTTRLGDCFYDSVCKAVGDCYDESLSVAWLRGHVARRFGDSQLCHYRVMAAIAESEFDETEYDWLLPLANAGVLSSLEKTRAYLRREGTVYDGACVWADEFAFVVVGELLKLNVLVVDMERERTASPYRYLHRSSGGGYVVLKRQRLHFQPLVDLETRRAYWRAPKELPAVVRALWNIPLGVDE